MHELIFMKHIKMCKKEKEEDILPFAETWIDLDGITRSEVSQKEKTDTT